MNLTIPYNYTPREYQLPLLNAVDSGITRAVVVWHRRSGKDLTLWNLTIKKAIERVGTYYYLLPTYKQARKIIWDGMNDGFRFIDHIPAELRTKMNEQEMKIELVNGSIIQLVGTDRIDSIVGTNPIGCVFSEYSLQNPQAWSFIRPILAENDGWAVFNYTPRGKNHGWEMYKNHRNSDGWFVQKLTVEDTCAIDPKVLEREREDMLQTTGDDALYMQEYMCSFSGSLQGAYYGKHLQQAEVDGRIGTVAPIPTLKVHTFWDLGVGDSTAIWFAQLVGNEIHVIDYYEAQGEGLAFYVKALKERGYDYGRHYAPHDIRVRELGSGMSRLETARRLGINFRIVKNIGLDDGINALRQILPRMWFDEEKCKQGLEALRSYRKEWDEKRKEYKNRPFHDWSSHACLTGDTLVLMANNTEQRIDQIKAGEKVWTPTGSKEVLAAGKVKKTKNLLELKFDNGKSLICTPEHKIFTDRGVVQADALRYTDCIWNTQTPRINQVLSHSKIKNIGFREATTAVITGQTEKENQTYIEQSIKTFTGVSLKTAIYIIKTTTHSITHLIIWCASRLRSISHTTQRKADGLAVKKTNNSSERQGSLRKHGTQALRGLNGIVNMGRRRGKRKNGNYVTAMNATENTAHLIRDDQNTVTRIVSKQRLDEDGEKTWVYDLTVEKDHCYLANGILVSNSDAARYMAVALGRSARMGDTPLREKKKINYKPRGVSRTSAY